MIISLLFTFWVALNGNFPQIPENADFEACVENGFKLEMTPDWANLDLFGELTGTYVPAEDAVIQDIVIIFNLENEPFDWSKFEGKIEKNETRIETKLKKVKVKK